MRILVIGSKGFVGSACVRILSKEHSVTGADIVATDSPSYFQIRDANSFDELFAANEFDYCINASGSANVGFSFSNPEKDFELNVANVKRMLVAIKMHQPKCRFINFSSAAVYGNPKSLPIEESATLNPVSPYGKHKLASEELLMEYHAQGLATCSLRVFSAYGPGLHKQLFWDIYQKRLASRDVTLFGTGKESRDFIYIDDLVEALRCIMEGASFAGEAINVSSGCETTIEEAARKFLDASGLPYTLKFSGEVKVGDPLNWRASVEKLTQLGFSASTVIGVGLAATMADYAASGK